MAPPTLPRKRNADFPSRESLTAQRARAAEVMQRLLGHFPETRTALHWKTPFELLIATILSAQCTDVRVNKVTPELFRRFPDAAAMSKASLELLEDLVRTTGFFRNKAKSLSGTAKRLVDVFDGEVPRTMKELLTLPGVARKTANCVLGTCFGIKVGVVVDTHVGRIARRMGFTRETNPVKVERDLMKVFERELWVKVSHSMIDHGRETCTARTARCEGCLLGDLCPQRL
ncbi:MAG: endonuclease III [Planctomycetota bacterium]|jgi:endonuclease-3|nr:endonuclease III [Planctomycetota bacterium]